MYQQVCISGWLKLGELIPLLMLYALMPAIRIYVHIFFILDLPANITKLQMNSNLVTTLKKGAFKATPSLIYLSLSICKMSTIQDGAFQYAPFLIF